MKNSTQFLALIFIYILCISFCEAQKRPNIIFIMSDDHTSQALGAYGGALASINPTPVLDAFASEGILFENALLLNRSCRKICQCIQV